MPDFGEKTWLDRRYPPDLPAEHYELFDRGMVAARAIVAGGRDTDADKTYEALDAIKDLQSDGLMATIGTLSMIAGLAVEMVAQNGGGFHLPSLELRQGHRTFDEVLDYLEAVIRRGDW